MSCIKVVSKSCDLKAYADNFGKSVKVHVYNKGEIRFRKQKTKWEYNMMSLWYGKHEWKEIKLQIKETLRFLGKYGCVIDEMHKNLKGLQVYIDFPTKCRLGKRWAVQQDEIPLSLIVLCAKHKVSINIAQYA